MAQYTDDEGGYVFEFNNTAGVPPITITNSTLSENIRYDTFSPQLQKNLNLKYIEYLNNLSVPLEMDPNIELYTQSPFLKKQLTEGQTNLIIKCIEKEESHLDKDPQYIPVIDRLTVIAESSQTGKSFIPLELSSCDIPNGDIIQSTLIVVPKSNISSWKSKLPHIYNAPYMIIDSIAIMNTLLLPHKTIPITNRQLLSTKTKYGLNIKTFDISKITTNKVYVISSHIFDIFQYYSKLTKLVFARVFYDSVFNICDLYTLFDDIYINIYLMTNNRTIFPIYENADSYYFINNVYSSTNNALSKYIRCIRQLFIKGDITNRINEIRTQNKHLASELKAQEGHFDEYQKYLGDPKTSLLVDTLKSNLELISHFEKTIEYTSDVIITTILFNETQTQIQYLDTKTYDILVGGSPYIHYKIIMKCFMNKNYKHIIQYMGLNTMNPSQLFMNIGLAHSNHKSIIDRIDESTDCPICMETLECRLVTKCCHNVFCLKCFIIANIVKPHCSCPCCRKVMPITTHYIMEDTIPTINYSIDNLIMNSQYLNLFDNFEYIITYILSKSSVTSQKTIIIINEQYDYNKINKYLSTNDISSFLYKHGNWYDNENNIRYLDDFNKTSLYDCAVMTYMAYMNFIEMGYTLHKLDFVINYNSDIIMEAHTLPKIIKHSKIKDNVTTYFNLN